MKAWTGKMLFQKLKKKLFKKKASHSCRASERNYDKNGDAFQQSLTKNIENLVIFGVNENNGSDKRYVGEPVTESHDFSALRFYHLKIYHNHNSCCMLKTRKDKKPSKNNCRQPKTYEYLKKKLSIL